MLSWFIVLCFSEVGPSLKLPNLEKYGPFALVLQSNLLKCDHRGGSDLDVSGMKVYFYDFDLAIEYVFPINEAADSILAFRLFNTKRNMRFFIPGYHSSIDGHTSDMIRNSLHALNYSYLFILDHSLYTSGSGHVESYENAVKYTNYIGSSFGQFLTRLSEGGVRPDNMHCIGHSLGGQILGVAGEIFRQNTHKLIGRITALDPAGPCFSNSMEENQVRSGVARYVEVYHCNSGELGSSSVLGDVDFFANRDSTIQPLCKKSFAKDMLFPARAAKCSHEMCVKYYTATVAHPGWFAAYSCKDERRDYCSNTKKAIAGFWNPGNATGIFYFSTMIYLPASK